MIENPCTKCDDPAMGCSNTCGDLAEYRSNQIFTEVLVKMFSRYNAICASSDCEQCPFNIRHKDCYTLEDQKRLLQIAKYLDNLVDT